MYMEESMDCRSAGADSMRYASITISWVADEKPIRIAPTAVMVNAIFGSKREIQSREAIMHIWDTRSQPRRRPILTERIGKGRRSIMGAQTNLKEYPRAAQLKNVTVDRSTPASRSQTDSVLNMSSIGRPAEKPRKSMASARGWTRALMAMAQLLFLSGINVSPEAGQEKQRVHAFL